MNPVIVSCTKCVMTRHNVPPAVPRYAGTSFITSLTARSPSAGSPAHKASSSSSGSRTRRDRPDEGSMGRHLTGIVGYAAVSPAAIGAWPAEGSHLCPLGAEKDRWFDA